jgi:alkanesulfonate monooxygenase SsuD/methylene tetrahydromethanopterin reductase-like flavin-dependent oxidoreductase (luciferase family)
LKLGVNLWSQAVSWPDYCEAARHVDRLGYDSLWTWDHIHAIYGDPDQPIFEGYSSLAAWGMATERVKLGLMVGANTFRNPGLVAKSVATLDHISNGRAILGIGGGWFEFEHATHGLEYGSSFGQRLDWLDEAVHAIRTLLDGGTVTSQPGSHYSFSELRQFPQPVQTRIPIMVGGNGRNKTLRTVARYADLWNGYGTPEDMGELNTVLNNYCEELERDPAEIGRTVNLWMIIRDDEAEARRVWERLMAHNGGSVDEAAIARQRPILGPPQVAADRIRQYMDRGFDTAIVELPAPYDFETADRLIGEVKLLTR